MRHRTGLVINRNRDRLRAVKICQRPAPKRRLQRLVHGLKRVRRGRRGMRRNAVHPQRVGQMSGQVISAVGN